MTDAGTESITGPNVQTPVVEHFVRDKPGELFLIYGEGVLDLQTISIAPGVHLRTALAPLKPIAFDQSEFVNRNTKRRAQREPVFNLVPPVWRPGLATKIEKIE